MKKITIAVLLAMLLATPIFANGQKESASAEAKAEVYFLNFKPEIAEVYQDEVAPAFEAETGIKLKVVTAASGEYAKTLKSEMAKSNPPVIFQTNGPIGLAADKDNAMPLDNTNFYKLLGDKSLALTIDDKVLAVPYAVEGYGIIYNEEIMNKYFMLSNKATTAKSMEDIKDFATLKAVVEDMTAKKDALGIKGVFASTSLSAGNDWRWQTHLVNVPLYAEFNDVQGYDNPVLAGLDQAEVEFKYNKEFKNIWDLYLNNSTTKPGLLGSKSVDDSMAEFALGQCAMVQNGNWGAGQILGVPGNKVNPDSIKFLPIYTGLNEDSSLGLCVGTENYLCINAKASADQQANADKFLTWLFSSETGKKLVQEKLGFITPFNSFNEDELPSDPLAKDVVRWMNNSSVKSIPWVFAAIPSQEFKNAFGADLLQYAQGTMNWDSVVMNFKNNWKSEYALTH